MSGEPLEEQEGPFHVCMVYADVYEVGQPNLGIAILYNALNKAPHISCERAYLPWTDMAAALCVNVTCLCFLWRALHP